MKRLLWLVPWLLACDVEPSADRACAGADGPVYGFHGEGRRGAYEGGPQAAAEIQRSGLELRWSSEPLDALVLDGVTYPPLIYASPLFVPGQPVLSDRFEGTTDVIYAATSNGWVYAIDARACRAGQILWRAKVSDAAPLERLDQGVPMGVLSTPVIDPERGLLYVSAHDARFGWRLHALALDSGRERAGWPVSIHDDALAAVNTNGPARFHAASTMSQRGALTLSPGGDQVYVAFGTFWGSGVGWLVAVDTEQAAIASAFSSAPSLEEESSGGIWGSAGPSVDAEGRVWATTGNSPPGTYDTPRVWGNALLQLGADLQLERSYAPFNYCILDDGNMDLGASQPLLLSPLPGAATPNLVAFGGKQGVVYLVDADALPEAGSARPPCSSDPASDRSLLGPTGRPLTVFGPYTEEFGEIDHAKMRTKLVEWTDVDGSRVLFASGTAKASAESTVSVAPSIAKLAVALDEDDRAYLELNAINDRVVMQNPGSPIVTGSGDDAVVWVLDRNALRTAALLDDATPLPRLYAFAASDLRLLWSSDADGPSGKYGSPIPVGEHIVIGTDRIEAWAIADGPGPDPQP